MKTIPADAVDSLRRNVRGSIVLPDDTNYDDVRTIWNGMIDKRPAMIVQCSNADDVVAAVNTARALGIDIAVRGAGHHIAGNSLCNDGMVIDLSLLRTVKVDPDKRRAYVDPGATLADLDAATQKHGLATPVGINSTTGVAGLTLGGGFGWLTPKYGMTVDNLVKAEVVTADGRKVPASETDNPTLFWAIRGGGGNFGVVTKFEYKLHPVGPEVFAGLMVFSISQGKQILQKYRDFTANAPRELTVWAVLRQAPPLPFLPEDVHGKPVIVLAMFYGGKDPAEGEKLVAPLKDWGDPHGTFAGPQPYTAWQQAFDPLLTPGARNYWKSHNFTELSDGLFDVMVEYTNNLPSPHCEIFIGSIGGAANDVPSDATAYAHRDAKFVMNVHGRWETAGEDNKCVEWSREFFKKTKPFASSGAYINFLTEDETERVQSAFGANYDKLVEVKTKYDPENVFHVNANIKPKK